ncbi:uncharacterized protein LOC123410960 isoform X2 [Hordeum vulgare subsp. vulgare]|uniref:uncharacterized protein LOC123410960 isoform X2 n=1 Tax=Hordeum vulgare subsp. vulgare TaxID=112509 RepID=UPI001D1A3AD0|nr:uncharacterized protein LOC123410960 isoform X2 [Hordeum vulgare subsp. vulgare]
MPVDRFLLYLSVGMMRTRLVPNLLFSSRMCNPLKDLICCRIYKEDKGLMNNQGAWCSQARNGGCSTSATYTTILDEVAMKSLELDGYKISSSVKP